MDNLLGLIFVLIAVSSAISKNKKKAGAARKSVVSPVQRAETHHKAKLARGELTPHVPAEKPVMVPRVETQLTMADAMRSGPSGIGAARANYAGSMLADTHEGEDPCHEDQLRAVPAPVLSPTPEERPGLTLDWNGENMVKAFVMQEVLTRPCQRRR